MFGQQPYQWPRLHYGAGANLCSRAGQRLFFVHSNVNLHAHATCLCVCHSADSCPCLSQIKVPPSLGEVLKAYTKEVIRVQPEDLIAFSAE